MPVNLRKILRAAETAVVWLFLLQALRVLFASLFGVIYDAVFDQTLSFIIVGLDLLLVVLAMLTPLLLARFEGRTGPRSGAALLVLAARIPLSLEHPTLRLYVSILLLGGAAFYVAHSLWHEPRRLMRGLILGLGADQVLRALDYTYDPTLRPGGLPFVVGTALATAVLSLYLARERTPTAQNQPHLSVGLTLGAALFVETSFLALPNALTHWSGLGYDWTAPLLLLVTLLPLSRSARALELYLATWLWPIGGIASSALTLSCVALAALLGGTAAAILLLLTQLLFLLSITTGVIKRRVARDKGLRSPGLEMSLGLILFLLLNFAFAFAFTYPYTLPFFRGLGTPFLLVAVLISTLPVFNVTLDPEIGKVKPLSSTLGLGGALVLTILCASLTRTPTLPDTPADGTLRLATYNIHYGFNTDWVFNLEKIAETIETEGVDVIVLQEVDAGRITSLSVDDALWLGRRLGMHVVYQPTLEKLSGIALLSRYPLQASDGQWLTSALEQTAIVHGAVKTRHGLLHAYGVWLGLESDERVTQIAEALSYIGSENPVTLGGDFNATPDSPVYARLLNADLSDPFTITGEDPAPTSPAIDPTARIDYIWLRGLAAQKAWVCDSIASDHRMVVVEVQLSP
jgi:endonuclease/exonuclease/phosphatase family metal-dependent hydrolase